MIQQVKNQEIIHHKTVFQNKIKTKQLSPGKNTPKYSLFPLDDMIEELLFPLYFSVYACMLSRFSHVQLFATPWTVALCPWDFPGKTLEWAAMPSSRGSSWPRDHTCSSCTTGRFLTIEPPGKPVFFCIFYNTRM